MMWLQQLQQMWQREDKSGWVSPVVCVDTCQYESSFLFPSVLHSTGLVDIRWIESDWILAAAGAGDVIRWQQQHTAAASPCSWSHAYYAAKFRHHLPTHPQQHTDWNLSHLQSVVGNSESIRIRVHSKFKPRADVPEMQQSAVGNIHFSKNIRWSVRTKIFFDRCAADSHQLCDECLTVLPLSWRISVTRNFRFGSGPTKFSGYIISIDR